MSPADDGRVGPSESTAVSADVLPAGLTPAACEAFQDVKEEFHDGLSAELRHRRRSRRDLTSDDVYEARTIVAHKMCRSQSDDARRVGSPRVLGAGLAVMGTIGVGVMTPYLHSFPQIAGLVVFGLANLAGVVLSVRSGHHVDTSGESAG